jgi:hypothetical protein
MAKLACPVVLTHADVVGYFSGYKNAFPFTQNPCSFVQNTVTADNSIKKGKGIPVLYDLIVFAYHAQNGVVVGAYGTEIIRNFYSTVEHVALDGNFVRIGGKQFTFPLRNPVLRSVLPQRWWNTLVLPVPNCAMLFL